LGKAVQWTRYSPSDTLTSMGTRDQSFGDILGGGRVFALVREAAAVLGADVRTVRRAIENGDVPAVRVGSVTRVPVAWLREKAMIDGPGRPS
jgi:excisionase family DNA binding protein